VTEFDTLLQHVFPGADRTFRGLFDALDGGRFGFGSLRHEAADSIGQRRYIRSQCLEIVLEVFFGSRRHEYAPCVSRMLAPPAWLLS
jgi:hypothetical protein